MVRWWLATKRSSRLLANPHRDISNRMNNPFALTLNTSVTSSYDTRTINKVAPGWSYAVMGIGRFPTSSQALDSECGTQLLYFSVQLVLRCIAFLLAFLLSQQSPFLCFSSLVVLRLAVCCFWTSQIQPCSSTRTPCRSCPYSGSRDDHYLLPQLIRWLFQS